MSRKEEMIRKLMWFLSHTLFAIIAVCAVRGCYELLQDLKTLQGKTFDLSELTIEQKNSLLETLMSEAVPAKRK